MVLVGRQHALAARRRSQHQQRIIRRRRPLAGIRHHRLGKPCRLAKRRPVLAADDGGDVVACHRLAGQRRGERRQHLQPGAEVVAIVGAGDPVANDKRRGHALAHQFARGNPADKRAAGLHNAEMADVVAAHPAERDMHEIIRADGDHRRRHDAGERQFADAGAVADRLAHLQYDIALRHDALDSLRRMADKDTIGRGVMHHRRRRAQRRVRWQDHRILKHQVGDAVLIGIGVDPLQRGMICGRRAPPPIHPAGGDIRHAQVIQLRHLAPGIAKRDDPLPGKRRQHALIDRQRDRRIPARGVAVGHRQLEMRRQRLEIG